MNRTQLTGRLVRDPDLRTLPDGTAVVALRLAVDGMAPHVLRTWGITR